MTTINPKISALLVIDMQNDFCPPTGSLAVPHGRDIIPAINRLLQLPFSLKIASKDNHPPNHVSFASQHPGKGPFEVIQTSHPSKPGELFDQTLWPDHCVQGTEGAEFVEGLDIGEIDVIIKKGQEIELEAYSAFCDVWEVKPSKLEQSLREQNIQTVFVVGLAEDFCVKYTSMDARKRGFRTIVVDDCTKGVAPESTEDARKEMAKVGVEFMPSSAVEEFFKMA